jgi:hypothetical protein
VINFNEKDFLSRFKNKYNKGLKNSQDTLAGVPGMEDSIFTFWNI